MAKIKTDPIVIMMESPNKKIEIVFPLIDSIPQNMIWCQESTILFRQPQYQSDPKYFFDHFHKTNMINLPTSEPLDQFSYARHGDISACDQYTRFFPSPEGEGF